MAITQADVDAFERAILANPGALEVSYGDKRVKFATLTERQAALEWMREQLAGANAEPRHSRATFSRA